MLTDSEQWETCQRRAREIVQAYRDETPEGFDPQNTWVAIGVGVAGVAVSAAGTAYSSSQSSKAAKKAAGTRYNTTPKLLGDPAQVDPYQALLGLYTTNGALAQGARQQASTVNRFNTNQAVKYYNELLPGFSQMQAQQGSNINAFLRGQLPGDVQSEITRTAANQGVQAGYGFGTQGVRQGAGANLIARNLGLNSLDLMKYGMTQSFQAGQNTKSLLPNLAGLQDYLLNPAQALGVAQQNANSSNQFALQNNALANQGIAAQNQVLANQTQQQYSAEVGQAQAIGQAAQQVGGLMSSYGAQNYGGGASLTATKPAPRLATGRVGGLA